MSDVSKTNEALIAEAQEHYSEMNGLNSRAAEVMMEIVAALEAKTGVRVDMSSAVGVETQLAATRVPVQGEPNDDREALLQLAFDHDPDDCHPTDQTRCKCGAVIGVSDGVVVTTDGWGHLVEMMLAAGFSRATVPDAASTVDEGKLEALIDRLDPEQRATSAALAKGIAEWLGGEKS